MNTVLQIIRESGGFHSGKSISIENEPWMRRAVEVVPELARTGDSNIYVVVVVLVRV
jgi:hypothetical protein